MAITAGMVTCFVLFDFFHLFGFFSSSGSCCGCIRVRRRMVLVHEGEADVEVPKNAAEHSVYGVQIWEGSSSVHPGAELSTALARSSWCAEQGTVHVLFCFMLAVGNRRKIASFCKVSDIQQAIICWFFLFPNYFYFLVDEGGEVLLSFLCLG